MLKIATEYRYKARDKNGGLFEGIIEAETEKLALQKLKGREYYPISLEETSQKQEVGDLLQRMQGIKTYDLVLFSRQFATMIGSGLSMVRSLNILTEQTENLKLREAITSTREKVEGGAALSEAMKQEGVFPKLFISMIEAGESAGILEEVLKEMARHYERENELKQELKSALTYPIVVIIISIIVVIGLITFVLPSFANIFSGIGGELPFMTRFLLGLGEFMVDFWYVFPIVLLAVFFGFKYYYNSEAGEEKIDGILLKLPVVGDLIQKISVARFSQTMSVLISSGVSILESFELTANIVDNKVISNAIVDSRKSVSEGESITLPLKRAGVFPPMVLQMIIVGEETGTLDRMLGKVASFYSEEVKHKLDGMVSMVEPLTIVFLGIVVGLILYSVMGPMFSMIGQI